MDKKLRKALVKHIQIKAAELNNAVQQLEANGFKVELLVYPEYNGRSTYVEVDVSKTTRIFYKAYGIPEFKHTPPPPPLPDNGSAKSQPWPVERDTFTGQKHDDDLTPTEKAQVESAIATLRNIGENLLVGRVKQALIAIINDSEPAK
mgnify:CR=1 FL=1